MPANIQKETGENITYATVASAAELTMKHACVERPNMVAAIVFIFLSIDWHPVCTGTWNMLTSKSRHQVYNLTVWQNQIWWPQFCLSSSLTGNLCTGSLMPEASGISAVVQVQNEVMEIPKVSFRCKQTTAQWASGVRKPVHWIPIDEEEKQNCGPHIWYSYIVSVYSWSLDFEVSILQVAVQTGFQ